MIYNFGSGFTPIYTDTDGTQHTVDEFKVVGGGLNKWIKGLARDSALGWDEASFGASPSRSTTAPFSMTNIDNIEFGQVAQFEATMPMMTIADFRDLQTVLHQRYFYVTFFNVQTLEWVTREMMVTNNEREKLYMRIGYGMIGTQGYRTPTIYGMQSVKVKFVATNRNLAEYDEALTITYDFNGGTLAVDEKNGKFDIGDQAQVYGRNDVQKSAKTLQYWLTDKGGVIFPAQRFTIFESLHLTAIWGEEDLQFVNIGYSLTNVHDLSALPTTMRKSATITVVFAADEGFVLPDTIIVSGSVASKWNKATGELTLSNPTSDITITVVGVETIAPSGDELLGTWLFNESLTTTSIPQFKVGFTTDGAAYNTILKVSGTPTIGYMGDVMTFVYNETDGWAKDEYRSINITDVSQLTNRAEFEAWLKANATRQAYDELLGTWVLRETISVSAVPSSAVGFITDNTNYARIMKVSGEATLAYGADVFVTYAYQSGGWVKQEYRVITITDTATLTNRNEFAAWLKANADKQTATRVVSNMAVMQAASVADTTAVIGDGTVSGTTLIMS